MFEQTVMEENFFLSDVTARREQAGRLLGSGSAAPARSIALLQSVLAIEIVCVLRYTAISVSEIGLQNDGIGAEFQEQANDERRHMRLVAERIVELGGIPDFRSERPAGARDLSRGSFARRLSENLAAEQSVIEHYREVMGYFAKFDPASRALMEDIMRDEEEHTNDLQDLIAAYTG